LVVAAGTGVVPTVAAGLVGVLRAVGRSRRSVDVVTGGAGAGAAATVGAGGAVVVVVGGAGTGSEGVSDDPRSVDESFGGVRAVTKRIVVTFRARFGAGVWAIVAPTGVAAGTA
jgi:hypothetical protein